MSEDEDSVVRTGLLRARKNAVKYWERRRWVYLAILVPPTLWAYLGASEFSAAIGDRKVISDFQVVCLFAMCFVGANICYTFAYAVEFLFFLCAKSEVTVTTGRTLVFVLGCLFGVVCAAGIARDIYLMEFGFLGNP